MKLSGDIDLNPGPEQNLNRQTILLYIRVTMKNLIGREHSINSQ